MAEWLNRTLVEAARTMLTHASLSNAFWVEAVATTTYLCNQMVSTVLKSGCSRFIINVASYLGAHQTPQLTTETN